METRSKDSSSSLLVSSGLVLYQASGGRLRTVVKCPWATQPASLAHPATSPVSVQPPGAGGGPGAAGRPEGPTASGPCSPPGPPPACRPSHSQSFGPPCWAFWGGVWKQKAYSYISVSWLPIDTRSGIKLINCLLWCISISFVPWIFFFFFVKQDTWRGEQHRVKMVTRALNIWH